MTLEDVAKHEQALQSTDPAEVGEAVHALDKALGDADDKVIWAARQALKEFAPAWAAAGLNVEDSEFKAVLKLAALVLESRYPAVRLAALKALGRALEVLDRKNKASHNGLVYTKDEKLAIRLEEIAQAEADLARLHEPIIRRVQELLDSLADRRCDSEDESKEFSQEINNLARRYGVDLTLDDQTVNVRWRKRVFEARAVDKTKKTLSMSAGFSHLTARATPSVQELIQNTQSVEKQEVRGR